MLVSHFESVAGNAEHTDAATAPEPCPVEDGPPVGPGLDASLVERPVAPAEFFRHTAGNDSATESVPKGWNGIHPASPVGGERFSPPVLLLPWPGQDRGAEKGVPGKKRNTPANGRSWKDRQA